MAEKLYLTIRQNADGPAKASGDSDSVEQCKLTVQIAADRYLCTKTAANSKSRDLRFNKLVLGPGGHSPFDVRHGTLHILLHCNLHSGVPRMPR